MKLQDKVSIITGAGRGIGRAIAFAFANEGSTLVINDVDEHVARKVKDEITGNERQVSAIKADVSKREQVERMIQETIATFKRIDILVNNAGVQTETPFLYLSEEDWNRILDTNLKGTFLCSQLCAEEMKKRKSGKIINISSIHEFYPRSNIAHYAASKGGIMMLTKTMALELAEYGINVNCIAPGAVDTDMNRHWISDEDKRKEMEAKIPLGRIAKPEEVAQAAVYLASSDADYITGTTIYIDGGLSLSGLGYKKTLSE